MKKIVCLIVALVCFFLCFTTDCAFGEEEDEICYNYLYVMSDSLRGRIRPGKKYHTVVEFDYGTPLTPTGRWSKDHQWLEIVSAENDLVWCSINYLTERKEVIHVFSLNDQRIAIRKCPGYGKVTGYVCKGQILEITQVIMGYGRCDKGWIDLSYFIEDCD